MPGTIYRDPQPIRESAETAHTRRGARARWSASFQL